MCGPEVDFWGPEVDFGGVGVPKTENKVIFGPNGLRGGMWTPFFEKVFEK